jgi:hypothetical protein
VEPDGIRTLELFVGEGVRRLPVGDACAPAERDTAHLEIIIDQRALTHDDRQRGLDAETQFRRGNRLEVLGLGEEIEDLLDRQRQKRALEVTVNTRRQRIRLREVVAAMGADDVAVIGHGWWR